MIKGRKSKLYMTVAMGLLVSIVTWTVITGADKHPAAAEQAAPKKVGTETKAISGVTAVIAGEPKELVAENTQYQLYAEAASGQIKIRDKRSGKEWLGAPAVDKSMKANQAIISAPVNIRYTQGKDVQNTYPAKEKAKIAAVKIENGIRFDYFVESLGLQFAVEYHLNEQGFEVKVPFADIQETSTKRLTSLEVLPFFEAAGIEQEGALFIPDGSGALIKFKKDKAAAFDFYSQFIYGGDYAFQTNTYEKVSKERMETISRSPGEKAALPVFGLYQSSKAFLGIVTEGDADTKINANPAGIRNVALYRTSSEFVYRNSDVVFVGNSGEIPMTQKEMIPGDRSLRYVLLQDDKANYVGMAQSYREYLTTLKQVVPVGDQKSSLHIELFGGAVIDEIIGETFVKMTTFEQAKTIIDQFIDQGISSLEIAYDGWSSGGALGNQPDHFPVAGKLGGATDLKDLAAYAKAKGIPLTLKANYVKVFSGSSGLKVKKDAIRGLNKEVMKVYKPYNDTLQGSGTLFYFLKPARVFDKYITKDTKTFASMGVTGVQLDYMGSTLYSNHSSDKPFFRQQTIETWQNAMDAMREKAGTVSIDYGFAYALGHVDQIEGIPMDSSHFIYTDEAIPFYQIAIRGLVPYTAGPFNQADDARIKELKLLEYGALPSYKLSYSNSSELKRTLVTDLFSTSYSYWLKPAVEEYSKLEAILGPLAGQAIVNHEILQDKVFRTTYQDGTQIIVNYNAEERTTEGARIAAFGYVVLKGGSQG